MHRQAVLILGKRVANGPEKQASAAEITQVITGNHVAHFNGHKPQQRGNQTNHIRHPRLRVRAALQIIRCRNGDESAEPNSGSQSCKEVLDTHDLFVVLNKYLGPFHKRVKSEGERQRPAPITPAPEPFVVSGHVSGDQGQSIAHKQGDQRMGGGEEHAHQTLRGAVRRRVEQDQEQDSQEKINGRDTDEPGPLAPVHFEEKGERHQR